MPRTEDHKTLFLTNHSTSAYTVIDKRNLELSLMPYEGDAHGIIYHGTMNGHPVRMKMWYGFSSCTNQDENLQLEFQRTFVERLDDWERVSGHMHIASFYGVTDPANKTFISALVSPLFPTNINEYLEQNPTINPLSLLLKVADAVSYMHSLDPPVIHRAIRGRNIAIDEHGEPQLNDSCIEFLPQAQGVSEDENSDEYVRWSAPEVVDPPNELRVFCDVSTRESDVYSFGMTLIEVLTGKRPWAERERNRTVIFDLLKHKRPRRPSHEAITDEMWTLIDRCTEHDPNSRPSMTVVRDELRRLYPLVSKL